MKHLFGEIARQSGLRISEGSEERLAIYIHERMRALKLRQPEDFLRCLLPEHADHRHELQRLAAVLTTGETSFMRDAGQIQLLRDTLLPGLLERRARQRSLRLWSAACSTGEEAYSLAILLHELLAGREDWQIALYGTDVNRDALRLAAAAQYGDWAFRGCDQAFRQRYFAPHHDRWVLQPAIRRMVYFMPGDLLRDPLPDPAHGLADLDLILCRNLFIYLQPAAIATVTHKLVLCLREGGVLLTGHGELHAHGSELLQTEAYPQSLVYRKGPPPAATPAKAPTRHNPATAPRPVAAKPVPPPVRTPTPARAPAIVDPLLAAWRLADAGRLDESLALCRGLLAQDPMRPEPHFLAAVLTMELGDPDAARESLRKALYLAPDMIAAHVHLERLQAGAEQNRAAHRTRAIVSRLLQDLPPDALVPFLGEGRAAELGAHWARRHAPPGAH
ncbi:CheR family methyltransferase [uncultured Thiodictyon sp.]|uniref:CheR family methyltransferase n=1 Tax=uncultured Thiodictyon sp. TaxID=1846217 RepID=UPI0025F6D15D|nr:CheR family methyltransferase [uncultured Thiodictyon sp.]